MSRRGLLALAVAIVVLTALALSNRRGGGLGSQGDALVPALAAALNDVERVEIVKAGGATVTTLVRGPETWTVVEKHGYRADVGKLRQTLLALSEARILERKTTNPELYNRLGVEDISGETAGGIAIVLTGANLSLPTVILGDAEGDKFRYARRAGEAESFLIDRDPDVPREAADWLDTLIVDVRADRVRAVEIMQPSGEVVTVTKAAPETSDYEVRPIPEGRELLYAGVANVVGNALRELNLEDVEPSTANEPAADALVRVLYQTFDGLVIAIAAHERGDDESWVSLTARAADEAAAPSAEIAAEAARINARVGAWRYRIPSYQYDQMTRRLSDLLKPPADPAP